MNSAAIQRGRDALRAITADEVLKAYPGKLEGGQYTFLVPSRPGYIYLRFIDGVESGVGVALNAGVVLDPAVMCLVYSEGGTLVARQTDAVSAAGVVGGAVGSVVSGGSASSSSETRGALTLRDQRNALLGGLKCRITPYHHRGGYHAGTNVLTVTPTATSGKHCWVLVGIDTLTNTLVQALSAERAISYQPMPEADISEIIAANTDVDWRGAILVENGATGLDERNLVDLRSSGQTQPKHNFSATGAPGTGDDSADGYGAGSVWLDVSGNDVYQCVDATATAAVWVQLNGGGGGGAITGDVLPFTCQARLTLESGVPISASDQTAKTTLYFTPYQGNVIAIYDGASVWTGYTLSEISASLAGLTADTNYDIFVYDSSGTLTLDLVAWTNGTTRTTALVLQDGVYVKSGATARRYIGTIRITSTTGQCEDSVLKRFVWNAQHRVARMVKIRDTTSSWTYQSGTIRQVRGQSTNQFDVVVGLREDVLSITALLSNYHLSNATSGQTFIGENSTTTPHADCIAAYAGYGFATWTAHLDVIPQLGYTYYAWLEVTNAGVSMTMYGASQGSGVDGIFYA